MIIVPDVHGRTFWKDAVKNIDEAPVVFLGDYLDPYYVDELYFKISRDSAFENFKDILEFKKTHPDQVILLLGNHDCEYQYGRNVCDCRCDDRRYDEIRRLFREYRDQFQLAAELTLGGKRFVFVHAGIQVGWMDRHIRGWDTGNMVELLNGMNREAVNSTFPEETGFANALSERDNYRNGSSPYGSPIWADALALHESLLPDNVTQVVGHSSIRSFSPVLTDNALYTDCGRILRLGRQGILRFVDGKECVNEFENPFAPLPQAWESDRFGVDCFNRPFCRKCGSHDIYIRPGMMADHWYCRGCGNDAVL